MIKKNFVYIAFGLLLISTISLSMSFLLQEGIRLDEAQSIVVVIRSVPELLRFIATDVHVPLYFLLLHFWIQVFGTGVMAARIMSFVFFLLTLPILYKLIREVSTRQVAMLTVTLFTLSPFVMWYTSEARMYTLFAFITTVQQFTFIKMVRSRGMTWKLNFIIATILGFYTHYFFNFLLLTEGIYILSITLKESLSTQYLQIQGFWKSLWQSKGLLIRFSFSSLIALMFFIPWLYFVLQSGSAANSQPLITPPTSYNIFAAFITFILGFQNNSVQAFIVSLWPLSLVVLFLVFTKRQRTYAENLGYFAVATFFPIFFVFAASFIKPIFLSRYLILVTPTLFFLIAWAMTSYNRKLSSFLIGFFLLLMSGLLFYQNTSASTPVREDYKSVTAYLDKNAQERDIIAVTAPFTVYPIEYYYNSRTRLVTIPYWNRFDGDSTGIPAFKEEDLVKQIDEYKKRYVKIYLVLSYDQGYEKKIRSYFDDNFELAADENFSPNLEVRSYILRYDVVK